MAVPLQGRQQGPLSPRLPPRRPPRAPSSSEPSRPRTGMLIRVGGPVLSPTPLGSPRGKQGLPSEERRLGGWGCAVTWEGLPESKGRGSQSPQACRRPGPPQAPNPASRMRARPTQPCGPAPEPGAEPEHPRVVVDVRHGVGEFEVLRPNSGHSWQEAGAGQSRAPRSRQAAAPWRTQARTRPSPASMEPDQRSTIF